MTDRREDWLWDRTGPADPELAELERLLRPLGHSGAPLRLPAAPRPVGTVEARAGRRSAAGRGILRRGGPLLLAAAVLLGLGLGWHFLLRKAPAAGPDQLVLQPGAVAQTIDAVAAPRLIKLPSVGEITLDPGSRLRVQRWDQDGTLLDLVRGRMTAFVFADVRPRFFQVDTPAARCVDLGCRYVLTVDEQGAAHVNVTMGYVAFAITDLEVFIPRGAECRAWPDRGPGTPRFVDCRPELRESLAALDALPRTGGDARRDAARAVLARSREVRDTLPVYHLLMEPDPALRLEAEQRLVELVDWPESARNTRLPSCDRGDWLGYLRTMWW